MNREGDMFDALLRAMAGESSDTIIRSQEHRGQQQANALEILPRKYGYNTTRQQFEQIGIQFLDDYDDLFVNVILPDGWKKEATSHDMWSYLLDDKGRKRASIFYKAAFYDRDAHISVDRRYSYSVYNDGPNNTRFGKVLDGETELWRTELLSVAALGGGWETSDVLGKKCEAWLDANYPDWKNPLAYWD